MTVPELSGEIDIFQLLLEGEKVKRKRKSEILESMGIKSLFDEGEIKIDMRTCLGVECRLCIKACPTNALYWGNGQVNIIGDLCIYCAACVLICMVDDCIRVTRRRADGRVETFSKPRDVEIIMQLLGAEKRLKMVNRRVLRRWHNGAR